MPITDIKGVGDSLADDLREEGFTSLDDVATADRSSLERVKGVGESKAIDLQQNARDKITEIHSASDADGDDDDEDVPVEGERPDFVDEDEDEDGDDVQTLSDAQSDSDEDEDDSPEDSEYPLTLSVSDSQFDYLISALVDMKTLRYASNPAQARLADEVRGEFRELAGSGELTLNLTGEQLNTLHSALAQAENQYQSSNTLDVYNAVRDLREQVNDARQEHLY